MKKGFTLVELAIVLVIIGLLIGGILAAQSMIDTAKVQRLIRNIGQYEIAINNFRQTYRFYPGDDPYFTPPGDGDDTLNFGAAGNMICNPPYSNSETFHSFAHLSQAQMIKGNYVPDTPTTCGGAMIPSSEESYLAIGPCSELDSKAQAAIPPNVKQYPIILIKDTNVQNLNISLYVNSSYVIPLEVKLGSAVPSDSAVGLTNPSGQGMCLAADLTIFSCTSSNAAFGHLYYYLAPI